MWKYTPTDELFTKKENNSLYHSDVYLGEDFSDGFKHYKYLRKYVKNGHTYYVYDESQLKAHERKYEKAADYINNTSYKDEHGDITFHRVDTKTGTRSTTRIGALSNSPRTQKDIDTEKKVNRALDYMEKHSKQKIKDIPRRIHAKGIAAISRMIKFFRGD